MAGDTDNYVCMRAVAEMKTPMSVLQQVVEENLDSACKLEEFASAHPGLQHIFDSFLWVSTLIMLSLSSSIVQQRLILKWSLAGLCRISLQREEIPNRLGVVDRRPLLAADPTTLDLSH